MKTFRVLFLLIIIIVSYACQKSGNKNILTPEEVFQKKDDLIGQTIIVRGTVQELWLHCTEVACKEQNPCCNSCWCGAGFWADISGGQDIALSGIDINCSGNGCMVTSQPFELGTTYIITGQLRDGGGPSGLKLSASSLYLDVADYRIAE